MAQVTVTIDDKAYRMACEEGQETHLTDLAARFDNYVGHLKQQFGEIGDLRLTVMAGIMVMDELSELQRTVSSLQSEAANLKSTRDSAVSNAEQADEALARSLGEITGQIESITSKLTGMQAR